jgi:hypothetical protein
MAFADPQSVTISGVTSSLPRVSSGNGTGAFQDNTGNIKLSASNTYGKRTRRMIRLDSSKIAADPLLAGVNVIASMSTYLVIVTPVSGFSVADEKAVVDAILAYLSASSSAKVGQLLGGES